MFFTWIAIGLVGVLLLWLIIVFNSLIWKKNRVKNAWADIDVQLKRRYDLIPNLVEIVKGYKKYEASVLEKITTARAQAISQTNMADKAKAENTLSGTLKNLFAVAENYPDLKASENFRQLQEQLALLENDIQSARRYYNAATREFNNTILAFPSNIVAGIFHFKLAEFFGTEEGEKQNVKVSL